MNMHSPSRDYIEQAISDLSKDAYGFRVRKNWGAMTDAQLQDEFHYYSRKVEEEITREKDQQAQALQDWTSHIAELQTLGAATEGDAIRWDMQALGAEDVDHYCYLSGLHGTMVQSIEVTLKMDARVAA